MKGTSSQYNKNLKKKQEKIPEINSIDIQKARSFKFDDETTYHFKNKEIPQG